MQAIDADLRRLHVPVESFARALPRRGRADAQHRLVVERGARQGVNPATGEKIQIAASKAPKFTAAKALKDSVNGR